MEQESTNVFTMNHVSQIVSMAVGFVFAYSVGTKLLNVSGLVAGIRGYQLLPGPLAAAAAALLIVAEVLIALAHLFYAALPIIVPGTIVLLGVFLVITVRLLRSTDQRPPCLCFGAGSEEAVGISSLMRIGLLLAAEFALCLFVYFTPPSGVIEGIANLTETLVIGALSATLLAWCFALPKFLRALHVVRT